MLTYTRYDTLFRPRKNSHSKENIDTNLYTQGLVLFHILHRGSGYMQSKTRSKRKGNEMPDISGLSAAKNHKQRYATLK